MATPDGIVAFECGEKAYRLQLGINAICMLEDHLKKTALDIATELQFNPSITTVRALFWAGLGEKSMTVAQAGDIVQALTIKVALGYAREALAAAFPAEDSGETGGGDADARPPVAAAG